MQDYVKHLKRGGLLAYPTETVWGIGGLALNDQATERLRNLKGRSSVQPFSVLVGHADEISRFAQVDAKTKNLIEICWPGPVTFVLPTLDKNLALSLGSSSGEIGFRCSPHRFVVRLMAELGEPITTTSANPSGAPPALSVADLHWLPADVMKANDDAPVAGVASTVVRVSRERLELLREGAIRKDLFSQIAKSYGFQPEF